MALLQAESLDYSPEGQTQTSQPLAMRAGLLSVRNPEADMEGCFNSCQPLSLHLGPAGCLCPVITASLWVLLLAKNVGASEPGSNMVGGRIQPAVLLKNTACGGPQQQPWQRPDYQQLSPFTSFLFRVELRRKRAQTEGHTLFPHVIGLVVIASSKLTQNVQVALAITNGQGHSPVSHRNLSVHPHHERLGLGNQLNYIHAPLSLHSQWTPKGWESLGFA